MTKRLLFLCTGNYYRSRYAELFFNALARHQGLNWVAESRGLQLSADNPGPLSRYTLARLQLRGFDAGEYRFPLPLSTQDLELADLVIALKEVEHRPLMTAGFSDWVDRVEYWAVHDIDQSPPEPALDQIEMQVVQLMHRLREAAQPV